MPIDNFGMLESRDNELGSLSRSGQPSRNVDYYALTEDFGINVVYKFNYEVQIPPKEFVKHRSLRADVFSGKAIRALVDEMHNDRLAGLNVHVHCTYGRDRTGVVVAAYRIAKQGWTVEEAWDEMKDYGVTENAYDKAKLVFLKEEFLSESAKDSGETETRPSMGEGPSQPKLLSVGA